MEFIEKNSGKSVSITWIGRKFVGFDPFEAKIRICYLKSAADLG